MTKKNKPVEKYELLAVKLTEFKASVDATINYEVRDKRHYQSDANVYSFSSSVELEGVCNYPEEREGEKYLLTIYGGEMRAGQFDVTLSDCQVRDDDGMLKYRKVRGNEIPIYEVPKGIGPLERVRGTKDWTGWCWVSPRTLSDMLALLPNVRPLYISIHEHKLGRHRFINALTLQTTDPAEE